MNKFFKILTAVFLALITAGCEEIPQMLSIVADNKDSTLQNLILSQPQFSNNWKTMTIEARLGSNVGLLPLSNPNAVRIEIKETLHFLTEANYPVPPKLVKVENVASQKMRENNIKLLALVDLTLPQHQVDRQQMAVKEMRNLFDAEDNLYVAFIEGTNVSETMPVTDYVLNNYFKSVSAPVKFLFRSIVAKMDEMDNNAFWTDGAKNTLLLVMSDGTTYRNELPMDPAHFEIQQQLAKRTLSRPLFYVNFSDVNTGVAEFDDLDDFDLDNIGQENETTLLLSRCIESGGLYQQQFNWPAIEDQIQKFLNLDFCDYRFVLENPDHKVYRGRHGRDLKIFCYDAKTDSLLITGDCYYTLGSVYSPIIVNPKPTGVLIMQGVIHVIFIALLVYLALQIIVPYIQYRLFLRKYVVTYTGSLMSKDGIMIDHSCYLCKGSFEAGDQIVTKCKHTMHLSCWNENQYQCPEYGRNCKDGRHYYNSKNLLDPRNSTFYRRWVLVGMLAALAAWIVYTAQMHPMFSGLSENIILMVNDLEPGTPEAATCIAEYGSHINHFPSFGLCIGFFLTLALSIMTVARREIKPRIIEIAIRSILGGLGGMLFFLLGGFISVVLGFDQNLFLIDWIPWTLTGYWIAMCVAWGTRIKISHYLLIGSILAGLVSTYLWTWLYGGSAVDYRITLLINFIIFAVAMAISIAHTAPHSERYFLSVSGIIKQMDIALYKWFKANPGDHVTIGHSVECSIQLSWDIQSTIAPIQAEIFMQNGIPMLHALEPGVVVGGKLLKVGDMSRLYHGRSFTIGKTTFTYIEKDK
ncbi:MAG: hypothetical protein K6F33_08655 [Bacteroidales bacterium]|nr:hypothetical protein [Bacteroidales bacterium]